MDMSVTKKDFYDYVGVPGSLYGYTRSYKLVLYKILFADLRDGRRSYLHIVASGFKDYFLNRLLSGEIVEKNADKIIEKINESSIDDVLDLILKNPFKYINSRGFLYVSEDEKDRFFLFCPELVKSLTKKDITELEGIVQEKLNLYFARIAK